MNIMEKIIVMNENKNVKKSVLAQVSEKMANLSKEERAEKQKIVENNLLEFANFLEAELALLYVERSSEVPTGRIIKTSLEARKGIALPSFSESRHSLTLMRINDFDKDVIKSASGIMEPNPAKCKKIPLNQIDIALIPGLAFDAKGGRVGLGDGYYNKLISKLPETTRKISIAFEEQMVEHVQMESRKCNVDIIITDQRTVFKI